MFGRTYGANNFTFGSNTVQSYSSYSNYIISFDSNGNLNNLEINDNLTYYNLGEFASSNGSIYVARYNANSWNDSSGTQYSAGISFSKFVNGTTDWVRTVNTTSSLYHHDGNDYTYYQYSEMFSD